MEGSGGLAVADGKRLQAIVVVMISVRMIKVYSHRVGMLPWSLVFGGFWSALGAPKSMFFRCVCEVLRALV